MDKQNVVYTYIRTSTYNEVLFRLKKEGATNNPKIDMDPQKTQNC